MTNMRILQVLGFSCAFIAATAFIGLSVTKNTEIAFNDMCLAIGSFMVSIAFFSADKLNLKFNVKAFAVIALFCIGFSAQAQTDTVSMAAKEKKLLEEPFKRLAEVDKMQPLVGCAICPGSDTSSLKNMWEDFFISLRLKIGAPGDSIAKEQDSIRVFYKKSNGTIAAIQSLSKEEYLKYLDRAIEFKEFELRYRSGSVPQMTQPVINNMIPQSPYGGVPYGSGPTSGQPCCSGKYSPY